MRPTQPLYVFSHLDDHGSMVVMDVNDTDTLEMLADGIQNVQTKVADSDFFNSFQDDFDDADIN